MSADHFCEIRYSRDGGNNFSSWTQHSLGAVGRFQNRVLKKQMGQSRQWVIHIRSSSPIRRDLLCGSVKGDVAR